MPLLHRLQADHCLQELPVQLPEAGGVAAAPQLWLMLLPELQLLLLGPGVVVSPLWLVQHLQGAQSCMRP